MGTRQAINCEEQIFNGALTSPLVSSKHTNRDVERKIPLVMVNLHENYFI